MNLAGNAALLLAILPAVTTAQSVRIVKFAEAKPFQMGKVTSVRSVSPDLGAGWLTLNYSTAEISVSEGNRQKIPAADERR